MSDATKPPRSGAPTRRPGPSRPRSLFVDGPREVAARALARVLDDGGWAAPTLSSVLDQSGLSDRDRALCTELFYGALRFAQPLERSLLRGADKPGRGLDARMRPHLLIAAYQLQHLSERIPAHAAVDAAVTAVRRTRPGLEGFANALLRRLGSPLSALVKPDAPLPELAAAWGVPLPLAEAVIDDLPVAERAQALGGLCARPTTYALWLDGARPVAPDTGRGEHGSGEAAAPHAFVPGVAALPGGRVSDASGFKDGGFLVMDPGLVLCALAVAARPGQRVVDLCSAPGGKACALGHAVGPAGLVVAVEQSEKRSKKIHDSARRLRLAARLDVVVGDAADDAVLARVRGLLGDAPADAVLLDAPCSGLGTTRRKPEVKLRKTADDVAACVGLQRRLLDASATLVAPGGVLVYSVCSPLPDEGTRQIAAFVQRHPDFVIDALPAVLPFLPDDAVDAQGCLRLLPHRHDSDAFFVARLLRRR
ncbi:MAG: RsmB/NOP family class I SAM-dependent RNA methyltransferase [Deltaproteobacteria bacterium]|nr:RsmB/NOP family class I SAM-dependent RNA methyltransferase [Deltaproteobacteria bacterium]